MQELYFRKSHGLGAASPAAGEISPYETNLLIEFSRSKLSNGVQCTYSILGRVSTGTFVWVRSDAVDAPVLHTFIHGPSVASERHGTSALLWPPGKVNGKGSLGKSIVTFHVTSITVGYWILPMAVRLEAYVRRPRIRRSSRQLWDTND